jgi:outer membrane lipoprotein-sorting protein
MRARTTLTFLLFIISVTTSYSQLDQDPKAKEILKGVSEKYRSYKSVSADFKITIEDLKAKTKDVQAGKIVIKGSKYKLTLADQEVISDGKVVWTFLKESNEVQINDPTSKTGTITPDNIFTLYENGFGSRFTGEKNIEGKT